MQRPRSHAPGSPAFLFHCYQEYQPPDKTYPRKEKCQSRSTFPFTGCKVQTSGKDGGPLTDADPRRHMDPSFNHWSWENLEHSKRLFLRSTLAPSTKKTYGSGVRQYREFCAQLGIPPFPLREEVLENFCVALAYRVGHNKGVPKWRSNV